jgi:hypothetical protein
MLVITRTNTLVRNLINLTIKRLKMSEGKVKNLMEEKMTPEQQAAAEKAFRKQQATDMSAYKKRLREGNDLKKLQVEELELNVRYFNAKKLWLAAQPELDEIEAQEQAAIQEEQRKRRELIEKQKEEAEKSVGAKEKTPEIVVPKQGKARES